MDILRLWMLPWCDYVVRNSKFRLRTFFSPSRYENWTRTWNLLSRMFANFTRIRWNVKYSRRKVCFFKVHNYDTMRSIRNTVLFSSSITLLKILHVVGLVPYITDNSSERLNLDDGKWVGAVTARETLWAEAAYAHVKKLNCSDIFFTSSKECQRLMLVHKSSYIVHVAPFSPQGEYDVILPDEKLTRRNTHEGVLVFDPYPHANFGHLVIVFVVDVRSKFKCEHKKGIYIGKFLFSPLPYI